MRHCRHEGPLRVQRPFYPETDGTCHVYLLHPPGGVVGGDELEVKLDLQPRSRVLLTTPGASKLYRSGGAESRIRQRILAGREAHVEWLPQETIVFDGALVSTTTVVTLEERATFVGWEVISLGRAASCEDFVSGCVTQRFEVWRDGVPLFYERLALRGGDPLLAAPWGLRGCRVAATFVVAGPEPSVLAKIRDELAIAMKSDPGFGGTVLEGAAVFRLLGTSAREVRRTLESAWRLARCALGSDGTLVPRIWKT